MTRVSVVIPARNAGRWIERAIASVAVQTLPAHEIIVVDNGSSDDTRTVVERLRRSLPNLTLLLNPRDRTPGTSRNIGLDHATGEWKALLDADDWFAPTRLERLIGEARRFGANIVADNQFMTPDDTEPPTRLMFKPGPRRVERVGLAEYLRRDRNAVDSLGMIKPILHTRFLEQTGLRFEEDPSLTLGEDSLFYAACVLAGESILLVNEPLYYYRRHSGSLSRSATAAAFARLKRKNIELLGPLRAIAPPDLARHIDRRIADLDDMIAFREIVAALSRGHWREAARRLLSDRGRTVYFIRRAARACLSRLPETRLRSWLVRSGALPTAGRTFAASRRGNGAASRALL